MRKSKLFRQFHVKLAVHRVELRLWRQVSVLVNARVAGDMSRELLRVLNDTGNRGINFPGHFVQEVGNLDRKSGRVHSIIIIFIECLFTYRLDKPTVTTKFEPAEVATPRCGQHNTVGGLCHFVEWQCVARSNLCLC